MRQPLYRFLTTASVLVAVLAAGVPAGGQSVQAPLDRGFVRSSSIALTVNEMLGTRVRRSEDTPILGPGYPALWIAEVQYKSVRLLRMNVTDPKTGKSVRELVWYMVYRVIPRDYTDLAGDERDDLRQRLHDESIEPANAIDAVRAPGLLMPRFVLQTTDAGSNERYTDELNLEIQNSVFRREFHREASRLRLLNSIQAISEVGEPVSQDDANPLEEALYGVAIWRNVDPDTDYFNVEMTGFSNAYRLSTTDGGETITEEKCIVQKFGRPGDRFDQHEREFRVLGDPEWIYRKRDAQIAAAESVLPILRNGSSGNGDE